MMQSVLFKRGWALLFPGGMVLTVVAILFSLLRPWTAPRETLLPYVSCTAFTVGLLLSAMFRRSRIFFALLCFMFAELGLCLFAARLQSPAGAQFVLDAVAILLPINIVVLAAGADRGIVTAWGRWEMLLIGLQAVAVGLVCLSAPVQAAALLGYRWSARGFADWSRISQLPLLIFTVGLVILLARLWRRRTPVESGMFWALAASLVGIEVSSGNSAAMAGIATSAAILAIAVLENSYSMAFLDELTGLPGRRSFNEALLKLGESYTIAMVDVDHFKLFNDTFGHAAGDQVLQMVAGKLAGVGGGGSAFRYGGEEFAVLFPEVPTEGASAALEELRQRIEQVQFRVRGKERRKRLVKDGRMKPRAAERRRPSTLRLRKERATSAATHVTVSIGVAASSGNEGNQTPEAVLHDADKALYRAKQQGRNRVICSTN